MHEFLYYFSKISYVTFIIGSVFFGMSIAFNLYLKGVIKKILKSTNEKFNQIEDKNSKDWCLNSIKNAQIEYVNYLNERAKIARRKKSLFSLKKNNKNETTMPNTNALNIFTSLAKSVSMPFSFYNDKERGYLSFTEREIFLIAQQLRVRIEEIINSSNVIWLKSLKISFFIECWNLYDGAIKIKNKPFVLLFINVLNFFLWFTKFLSPVGVSKYIVSDAFSGGLSSLMSSALIEIAGKELAVIYYDKSKISNSKKALR